MSTKCLEMYGFNSLGSWWPYSWYIPSSIVPIFYKWKCLSDKKTLIRVITAICVTSLSFRAYRSIALHVLFLCKKRKKKPFVNCIMYTNTRGRNNNKGSRDTYIQQTHSLARNCLNSCLLGKEAPDWRSEVKRDGKILLVSLFISFHFFSPLLYLT